MLIHLNKNNKIIGTKAAPTFLGLRSNVKTLAY